MQSSEGTGLSHSQIDVVRPPSCNPDPQIDGVRALISEGLCRRSYTGLSDYAGGAILD